MTRSKFVTRTSRRTSWAGIAAIFGGMVAILLSVPLATAYFSAYGGFDAEPPWLSFASSQLAPLLDFAAPATVYETYGRIYGVVFLLYLPAAVSLRRLQARTNRAEKAGFVIVFGALVATAVGVAADYWADGIGYSLALLGVLALLVGSAIWGIGLRRGETVPTWWARLLIAGGPLAIVATLLFGHFPSGPAFPFAVTWLALGWLLVVGRVGPRRNGVTPSRRT